MTMDRETILQVMARRAGFTETQVDALRRRDYAALLLEEPPSRADPAAGAPGPRDPLGDAGPLGDTASPGDVRAQGAQAPSSADLQVALERVSRRLATVRGQRDAALQLLRQLATRLGCCPDCWGSEPGCPTCGGLGSPGYFAPDPHLLDWLGPALDQAVAPAATPPSTTPAAPPAADQDPEAPGADGPTPEPAARMPRPATAHTDGWA